MRNNIHDFVNSGAQWASAITFCFSFISHCQADDAYLYLGPLTVRTGTHAVSLQQSDLLSNARILTALSGTELESYSYSPFGTRTIRDAMGNEIVESTYGVTLGFGSRPLVKYLNTLDFHHRLYNERNGSFLTRDPLHYIDTHNERQYAMHNPIDFTDYHGLMSQGGQTTAQGAGTGAPVIPPTGNPTGNGEKPNGPNICVNGGAPANNLPWIMQNVQLQSPGEYEKRLREKLDELIKQHGEDIITAHESGALVPWARPPEYVIWLLNGDRPAFQAAISTQSQADLAKALINGRKPKPYEPGGWAFNALGPNGAAYELIAVFAGVTAAPRVFRGSTAPAPTNLPIAFIAPRPRPATLPPSALAEPVFPVLRPTLTIANATGGGRREPTKKQILQELNDGIARPSVLREHAIRVSEYSGNDAGRYTVALRPMPPSVDIVLLTRRVAREMDQAGNLIIAIELYSPMLAPDQVISLRQAGMNPVFGLGDRQGLSGYEVASEAIFRSNRRARPGEYDWTFEALPGFE